MNPRTFWTHNKRIEIWNTATHYEGENGRVTFDWQKAKLIDKGSTAMVWIRDPHSCLTCYFSVNTATWIVNPRNGNGILIRMCNPFNHWWVHNSSLPFSVTLSYSNVLKVHSILTSVCNVDLNLITLLFCATFFNFMFFFKRKLIIRWSSIDK